MSKKNRLIIVSIILISIFTIIVFEATKEQKASVTDFTNELADFEMKENKNIENRKIK